MFKLPIPTRLTDYLGEAVVWTVISITIVGLILTKPGWLLFSGYGHSGYGQLKFISSFLEKKIKFLSFHAVVLMICEDLSINASITNVGLILTKPGDFFSWGRKLGTERHCFGILIWKHVGTQKFLTQVQNYWLAVNPWPYMNHRWTGMHNNLI